MKMWDFWVKYQKIQILKGDVFENNMLGEVFEIRYLMGEVFENTFHESESRVELEVCTPKNLL